MFWCNTWTLHKLFYVVHRSMFWLWTVSFVNFNVWFFLSFAWYGVTVAVQKTVFFHFEIRIEIDMFQKVTVCMWSKVMKDRIFVSSCRTFSLYHSIYPSFESKFFGVGQVFCVCHLPVLNVTENAVKSVKIYISQWNVYKLKVRPEKCIYLCEMSKWKASECYQV